MNGAPIVPTVAPTYPDAPPDAVAQALSGVCPRCETSLEDITAYARAQDTGLPARGHLHWWQCPTCGVSLYLHRGTAETPGTTVLLRTGFTHAA